MPRNRTITDPFRPLREATLAHIRQHNCGCYPFFDGSLLGTVAAAMSAKRILELGTALGYSALWFAHGAPDAIIDTVDFDPEHVRIARDNAAGAGFTTRIRVHEGDFATIMATLEPGYDLGFFDGFDPTLRNLDRMRELLRPRGAMITTNLDFGNEASGYRERLADPAQWLTTFAAEDGRTAISIKR